MYSDDPYATAVGDTVWLIRHVAHSLRGRHPLPRQVCRALTARRLDWQCCLGLLTRLAGLLPTPLAIGPPCSTLCSEHERQIARAVQALEAGDAVALEWALQRLAAPVGLSRPESRQAGRLLARLAGYRETARGCPAAAAAALAGHATAAAPKSAVDQGFSP